MMESWSPSWLCVFVCVLCRRAGDTRAGYPAERQGRQCAFKRCSLASCGEPLCKGGQAGRKEWCGTMAHMSGSAGVYP